VSADVKLGQFEVTWYDTGSEPQCGANPAYPEGIDVDASGGADLTCQVALPYPAKRVGGYIVECRACGMKIGCTTAGRPDDPRSLKMACRLAR